MSGRMTKVEVELTKEEAEKLAALLDSGDDKAVEQEMIRLERLASAQRAAREFQTLLLTNVVLSAHHYLHKQQPQKALELLCPMVALIDGDTPPQEILLAFHRALKAADVERAKDGCEGHA